MAKLSSDDIEGEGEMAKRRKTNEGGKTLNPPSSGSKIKEGKTLNPQSQSKTKEGKTLNPTSPQNETGEEKERATIDTDFLECSICFNPLYPPVNQCRNGHVACPSCWSKRKHICHMCNLRVQFRNNALEKILEAAHVPCPNAYLGCGKSVSFPQMQAHTATCKYGRPACPIPGCLHKASSGEWRGHFLKYHWDAGTHYSYGESSTILFNEEDLYYTLLGPVKDLFLLVKEPIPNVGTVLSLYFIDLPDLAQNDFKYKLKVYGRYNTVTMQMNSPVISIKDWKRGQVGDSSLLVPLGFTDPNMKIHVLIKKEVSKKLDEGPSKRNEELDEGLSESDEGLSDSDEESDTILSD
ncbi:putative E3 ubiquitin-protein ligase SINA-like 9 [Carex littledalei]|uniref:RING-type E3 ubiquitin transferase n=1 Tax=Carex littledalei TaxID=544730 RepID=A0A833RI26_9POAL|nr:putative E3 ubiquitin-protein ligase SINA-like 9 [Carex littledalei]